MLNLWSISPNKVILNEEELETTQYIKVFRELHKLVSLDHDKTKLFRYVWNMADYRSVGIQKGYGQAELHYYALKQAELPENWVVVPKVVEAIEAYKILQEDVLEEQFKYIKQVQHNTARMLALMNKSLETHLGKKQLTSAEVDAVSDMQNKIAKIADELPKRIKTLKELEALVLAQRANTKVLRGKQTYRSSMDGDRV